MAFVLSDPDTSIPAAPPSNGDGRFTLAPAPPSAPPVASQPPPATAPSASGGPSFGDYFTVRPGIKEMYGHVLNALQPDPSHTYSEFLPWAWATPQKTDPGWPSLPQSVRDLFAGALQPTTPSDAFYKPGEGSELYTGQVGPAGQIVMGVGARPLRFGEPVMAANLRPSYRVPDQDIEFALRQGGHPVSADTDVNRATYDQAFAPPPPPAAAPVSPPSLPPPTPTTAAATGAIGDTYYKAFDRSGGQMTPNFSNGWLDDAAKIAPQNLGLRSTIGANDVTDLLQSWERDFRDQPMSAADLQGMRIGLGRLISKNLGPDPGTARNLIQIKNALDAKLANATPADMTSGDPMAFQYLKLGNQAYSQEKKMQAIEEIDRRASIDPDKYDASVKSQLTSLLKDQDATRGYSDDEVAGVKDAIKTGTLTRLGSIFGGKLTGALAGSHFGPLGTVAGTLGAEYLGPPIRGWAANARAQQIANVLNIMGQGVPPNPLNLP